MKSILAMIKAKRLIDELHKIHPTGGHLHVAVDDGNLSNGDLRHCGKDINENQLGVPQEQLEVEKKCLIALLVLTEDERCVVYEWDEEIDEDVITHELKAKVKWKRTEEEKPPFGIFVRALFKSDKGVCIEWACVRESLNSKTYWKALYGSFYTMEPVMWWDPSSVIQQLESDMIREVMENEKKEVELCSI